MLDDANKLEVKEWNKAKTRSLPDQTVISIYSNFTAVGFSNWDMWITFGEIAGEHEGQLVIDQKARVVMSLQHAKAFFNVLKTNLEAFEKEFGEIQLFKIKPDQITESAPE